jgi:hypothetical protein
VLALIASSQVATAVAAYEVSPLKDRNRGGEWPKFARAFDTVHEDITHAAVACADAVGDRYVTEAQAVCVPSVGVRKAGSPGNIGNPLIVGVWWNDDPRQFLYANDILTPGYTVG